MVNEWDEQERLKREREQMEDSLYRNRSRLHGSGLTEDEQDERDFRNQFPLFSKVFPYGCLRTIKGAGFFR